ncbi:MAG: hypothetical protein U1E70_09340 [Acetobacteraceae bacterium]
MNIMPWLPIFAKALATALTVMSASVAAEALGPFWGALIVCLPVAAGPAYVFLALEHGPDFIAASALSSAAATALTGLFLIVFSALASRFSVWRSLSVAAATWLAASLLLQQVAWTVGSALALNALVYGSGLLLMRRPSLSPTSATRPHRRRWFELPLRGAAVAAFVSLIVTTSNALGPAVTGIAAVFPVSMISLFIILGPRVGGPATAHVAMNALPPMMGFAVMLVVMHLAILPLGIPVAYCLALAVSLLWSGALLLLQLSKRR